MKILLGTLVLNEMEWLPKLYEQHKDWPELVTWVFVESADIAYARANPEMTTRDGLSVDGTTEFLQELAKKDDRIIHLPYGFSSHRDAAQGKCAARNQYLIIANQVKPDFVYVLDADEFYVKSHQQAINQIVTHSAYKDCTSFTFKQTSIWHPPSIADEYLFKYEVIGGFWAIPHCHMWRYVPGMKYAKNHNHPCDIHDKPLTENMAQCHKKFASYSFIHMACAASLKSRHAKHKYYIERGEGVTDSRGWYVDSRAAFETWKHGDALPGGAQVIYYRGLVPEVFL